MSKDGKAGITEMLRQGAGLVGLQKYFDNWDISLQTLTGALIRNICANWTPYKFSKVIGVPIDQLEDFANFDLRNFSIICSEGMYSDTQRRSEFMNIIELCSLLGIKPPTDLLIDKAPIQGKLSLKEALNKAEQAQQQAEAETKAMEQAVLYAELQRTHAQTVDALNLAKERAARAESNMGLKDEREAEVSKNKAIAEKTKVEAAAQLLELISIHGKPKVEQLLAMADANVNAQQESTAPTPIGIENHGTTTSPLREPSMGPQGQRSGISIPNEIANE